MFLSENRTWETVKRVLAQPETGKENDDIKRLNKLWMLFNSPSKAAYLTVKLFLVFREIRIQFRKTGEYQYHPAICCVPGSHVRSALAEVGLIEDAKNNSLQSLIRCSKIVSEHFSKAP